MAELGNKFEIGQETYDFYKNVKLDKKTLISAANDALEKDDFHVLAPGGLILEKPNGSFKVVFPLTESHLLLHYAPDSKELFTALYTCRGEGDGKITTEEFAKSIGVQPHKSSRYAVPVKLDLSIERGEKGFSSIDEAVNDLKLKDEDRNYLAAVFYKIPNHKLADRRLENILTKASNLNNCLPDGEYWKRFKPGYSVIYLLDENGTEKDMSVLGAHTFGEHNSIHYGGYGKVKNILPRIKLLGELLKSKYIVLRKAA